MGKKLKLIVFGLLLLVVIGFVVSRPNNANYQKEEILSIGSLDEKTQKKALGSITKKDTDKDGLKDWEEALWNTDPNNPDTDGDGKTDGDEIKNNTNPVIAWPDDKMDDEIFVSSKKANIVADKDVELTNTQRFAESFFEEYLSLKRSDAPLDSLAKEFLIDSVVNDSKILSDEGGAKYSTQEILVLKDESDEFLKNYGNLIVETVQKYAKAENEDELSIFEKALRYEDKTLLEPFDNSIFMYKSLASDFIKIRAPKDLVSIHLDITNGYANIASSLKDMSTVFEDPILGLEGLGNYIVAVERQVSLSVPIRNYFLERNIVFAPDEFGSVWNVF